MTNIKTSHHHQKPARGRRASMRPPQLEPANLRRSRRLSGQTPIPTPVRDTHNRARFGENQIADFSFAQPTTSGWHGGRNQLRESSLERIESFVEDRSTFGKWKPDTAIGSPLCLDGEDLSRIQLADRNVAQWRRIMEAHGDPPHMKALVDEAIKERLALDDSLDENTLPISTLPSTHRKAIKERIEMLTEVLAQTENAMQLENMKGAIAAYQSGEIAPDSDVFTIIWAGHVVDTVSDLADTLGDREERLDRYVAQHGPGSIWFEPPLKFDGFVTTAKKSVGIENVPGRMHGRTGFFSIRMGFRPRTMFTRRNDKGVEVAVPHPDKDKGFPHMMRYSHSQTTTAFSTMLDSGATYPVIFWEDLKAMNINTGSYPAQTLHKLSMADQRIISAPTYELDVFVLDNDDQPLRSYLDNAARRIWPTEGLNLGVTTMVSVLPGKAPEPANSLTNQSRLSGMVPFQACYISGVPGTYLLWLGEDRSDVLGADKMPGQRAYHGILEGDEKAVGLKHEGAALQYPKDMGTAKVIFEHHLANGSTLRDEDVGFGRSLVTIASADPGGPDDEGLSIQLTEPRLEPKQQKWIEYAREKAQKEQDFWKAAQTAANLKNQMNRSGWNRPQNNKRRAQTQATIDEGRQAKKQATDLKWYLRTASSPTRRAAEGKGDDSTKGKDKK